LLILRKGKYVNKHLEDGPKVNLNQEWFSQKIKDILVGTLLGDCGGSILTKWVNPIFTFKQSYPEHAAYLYYIYFIFLH
jgi:hypothetical protein